MGYFGLPKEGKNGVAVRAELQGDHHQPDGHREQKAKAL